MRAPCFCSLESKILVLIAFIPSIFIQPLFTQPTINSFIPASGAVGTTVMITGTNFSALPSDNIVYFGATAAAVTSATSTLLTLIVPPGSTFQPISVTTNGLTAYSNNPFIVTFGASCPTAPPAFTKISTLSTNSYPRHIVSNDIDGDGRPDLVVTNHLASGFSVFRNTGGNGTIAFASPLNFISGTEPFATAIGDLNGDGKHDVVTHSYPGNALHIFINASTPGIIAFASKIDIPAGLNPIFMAIADLDKDGKPEILAVNNNGNSVSVFKNTTNAAISFAPKVDFPIGKYPGNLFVVDFDGDGYSDVAAVNFDDNTVSVLRNTSTNTNLSFASKKDYSTGVNPFWVTAGDLDNDSKAEMIVTNSGSNSVSVFKNTGVTGTLSFAAPVTLTVGNSPLSVSVADINGNGKPDLTITNFGSNNISVINNTSSNGNLWFDVPVNFNTGSLSRSVAITDLDGDNKPDLSVVNSTANTLTILKNSATIMDVTVNTTSPKCLGKDGNIIANVNGGVSPYQYSVNGFPYQSSNTFSNLAAGIYTIRVKDATDCTVSIIATVKNLYYLSFNLTLVAASCGNNNGSVSIAAIGSTPPFLYSLDASSFQSSEKFNNLPPGIYNAYVKDNNGCISQTGFAIQSGCITVTVTATDATCSISNGNISVNAGGGMEPYLFSIDGVNFQTSNYFKGLSSGSYTVSVKDASGIVKLTSVNVGNIAGPQLAIARISPTDCNNSSGQLQVQSVGGTLPLQYSIDGINFQAGNVFQSLAKGNYTVVVIDANSCRNSLTANIAISNTLQVNAGAGSTICEGSSTQLEASSNGTTFQWSPVAGISNPASLKPIASPVTTTTYTLSASSGICTETSTVTVEVNAAPVAFAGSDTAICLGKDIRLQAATGASGYLWSPAKYLDRPAVDNPIVQNPPVGRHIYFLDITDANGCISLTPDLLIVTVKEVKVFAGNDTIVAARQSVKLNAADVNNSGLVAFNWSPSIGLNDANSKNPVAILEKDMTYLVTAKTREGCVGTDGISIKVYNGPEIYVPNAFTPNGDGRNDALKAVPVGLKNFTRFTIFNRWGQVVFTTADALNGWNGKLNGIDQTGVFVWLAEGNDYKNNIILRKGTTVVVR